MDAEPEATSVNPSCTPPSDRFPAAPRSVNHKVRHTFTLANEGASFVAAPLSVDDGAVSEPVEPGRSGHPVPDPQLGTHRIDTGSAELQRDLDRPNAYLLMINDMESSYIDLDDPTLLDFEYLRWMAAIIEHQSVADVGLTAVHLGAAGCTLIRHLLAVRPDSRHLAVDIDAELLRLAARWFGLPGPPGLEVRIGDAREVTVALPARGADVLVRDVFAGSTTPWSLTTVEFTRLAQRALTPAGIYLLNCADTPDLQLARAEAATVGSVFQHVLLTADPTMLKGRRRGNVVIAGSDRPFDAPDLARALLAGAVPAQLWLDDRVREFGNAVSVLRDGAPGVWPTPSDQQARGTGSTAANLGW